MTSSTPPLASAFEATCVRLSGRSSANPADRSSHNRYDVYASTSHLAWIRVRHAPYLRTRARPPINLAWRAPRTIKMTFAVSLNDCFDRSRSTMNSGRRSSNPRVCARSDAASTNPQNSFQSAPWPRSTRNLRAPQRRKPARRTLDLIVCGPFAQSVSLQNGCFSRAAKLSTRSKRHRAGTSIFVRGAMVRRSTSTSNAHHNQRFAILPPSSPTHGARSKPYTAISS